jgi:hypothetical protein
MKFQILRMYFMSVLYSSFYLRVSTLCKLPIPSEDSNHTEQHHRIDWQEHSDSHRNGGQCQGNSTQLPRLWSPWRTLRSLP